MFNAELVATTFAPGPSTTLAYFYPFAVEVRLVLQIFFTYF